MNTNPIENLALVLSKSISNTMDSTARLQEMEQSMEGFKQWAKSVLGDDYEDIVISTPIDTDNYQEKIDEVLELLKVSYEEVRGEIDELKEIPSTIFIAPKIKKRITINRNKRDDDDGFCRGIPSYLTIPLPVDEESAEVYNECLQSAIQYMQAAQKYFDLIKQKTKKNPSQFVVNSCKNETFMHYDETYTDSQLLYILTNFKDKGYIANSTNEKDFMYFFSGKGDVPEHGLKWSSTQIGLAVFLKVFYYNDNQIWKKAENIFGIGNLSKTYNCKAESKKGKEHEVYFEKLLKEVKQM